MAHTVFMLGAGASQQAGAPLMANFLDVARDLLDSEARGKLPAFEAVFRGISHLQRAHSKSTLDIHNVESVFAAFEMAKTVSRFADYNAENIEELISSMREVILHTLDCSIKLPARDGRIGAPPPYPTFAKLVHDISRTAQPSRSVAVLTFNYDVCVDFAFPAASLPIDYRLGSERQRGAIPLLKLHGSLNWARCSGCSEVVAWPVREYLKTTRLWAEGPSSRMHMGAHIKRFKHCDQEVSDAPIIVPPTWNKTDHHRALSSVWSAAAQELAQAQNLFIIGYSLPESDAFFRYLFALGTIGEAPLRRVWVCNPDKSPELEERFRALFGPGAGQRFKMVPADFQDAIGRIRDAFRDSLTS